MLKTEIFEKEYWWGGAAHDGRQMPLDKESVYSIDLATTSHGNQSVPFFLSTEGRFLWSESPFRITFKNGNITAEGRDIFLEQAEKHTLAGAYREAQKKYFPVTGNIPPAEFFTCPQYNTWAELTYGQNQQSVLEYARNAVKNGYKPGVLTIDDTWQKDYGEWNFEHERFPTPAAMVKELHQLGFRVMLWIAPYLSPDGLAFREAMNDPTRLVRKKNGEPLLLKWWNGYSAVLNLQSEGDCRFLLNCTHELMQKYGIDGFKFDGGNLEDFADMREEGLDPEEIGRAYHTFAAEHFPYHEVKDTWNCGGRPYIQRLRDKYHVWGKEGLADLIPDAIALSLTGHTFLCPDMIGGGEWTCFRDGCILDEELIVRYAQCSSLFPQMQFSVAPWRVLNQENHSRVLNASRLHEQLGNELFELAKQNLLSGEPLMRPLEYNYPHQGYAGITDQFLLGDQILAAPVLEKGASGRNVVFPPGIWQDETGNRIAGPSKQWISALSGSLPWYRKQQ